MGDRAARSSPRSKDRSKKQDVSDVPQQKPKKSKKKRKRTAEELEAELASLREAREKYLRENLKIKVEFSTSKKNLEESKKALACVRNQLRADQTRKVELTESVSANLAKKQRLSESLARLRGDLITTMSIEELSEFRKETMGVLRSISAAKTLLAVKGPDVP